jgi:putative NADH-flavin reductase
MPRVRFVRADVADARQVLVALDGADAVISTYGVPYTRHRVSVYSEGMANIIAAMVRQGVSRLVCVTSTSIAPGEAPGESFLWRKVFVPLLRGTVGRTLYDDMERMEALVVQSTLDWTIVRPGGLFNTDEPTDDYLVSPQRLSGRMTSRADLASVLLQEATHPTSDGTPSRPGDALAWPGRQPPERPVPDEHAVQTGGRPRRRRGWGRAASCPG